MRIGLVAGESSGDLLGAGLLRALRQHDPALVAEGVAGPAMRAAGCEALADANELAVMGLVEPLRHVPRLLQLRRRLRRHWQEHPPDVFVGIDAPDFNLGLEKGLRQSGVTTVHYVSPTVWAWRPGRIRKIAAAADCVMCLLPFEPAVYAEHDVNAVFVGHPRADELQPVTDTAPYRESLGLEPERPVLALLPGSRMSEVTRLAPLFAAAASEVAGLVPQLQIVTPLAAPGLRAPVEAAAAAAGIGSRLTLCDGGSITAMSAADVVLLASGTAVLESALLGKPSVAAYRVAPLTAAIVRRLGLLRVSHFTLPNLLTDTPQIPELIQEAATPEALAREVTALLLDAERAAGIRDEFAKLHAGLACGADQRAADVLLDLAARSRSHSA